MSGEPGLSPIFDDTAFERKVDRSGGPSVCWPWLGARMRTGYGTYRGGKKKTLAHRYAFAQVSGVACAVFVCHTCDHPWCVNPAHLFAGTAKDNMDDMRSKGRAPVRARHGAARLTEYDVREMRHMRAQGAQLHALAQRFCVSVSHVSSVCKGKFWP